MTKKRMIKAIKENVIQAHSALYFCAINFGYDSIEYARAKEKWEALYTLALELGIIIIF